MDKEKQRHCFQKIIEQHKGILFKVARVYCPNEDDRQDLIQEMMIQIWQSMHKYNNQFKLSTWLYRISLNVAISFYRKNAVRKSNQIVLNEQIAQIPETDESEQEQQLNLLLQFIHELKELDKALMLLYLEEKSYKEIAEIIGITETNVSTKISRIKIILKQKFSLIKNN
jgi:RNA polymerase sigma-70 factor (ECF subfamily)